MSTFSSDRIFHAVYILTFSSERVFHPLYKIIFKMSYKTIIETEQNRTEIYNDLDIYSLSSYYTNIATMQAIT